MEIIDAISGGGMVSADSSKNYNDNKMSKKYESAENTIDVRVVDEYDESDDNGWTSPSSQTAVRAVCFCLNKQMTPMTSPAIAKRWVYCLLVMWVCAQLKLLLFAAFAPPRLHSMFPIDNQVVVYIIGIGSLAVNRKIGIGDSEQTGRLLPNEVYLKLV